jgi:hypothetical protein
MSYIDTISIINNTKIDFKIDNQCKGKRNTCFCMNICSQTVSSKHNIEEEVKSIQNNEHDVNG